MFGSENLFVKSEEINLLVNENLNQNVKDFAKDIQDLYTLDKFKSLEENEKENFIKDKLEEKFGGIHKYLYLKRLYQQAKQLSQIIAYIWYWDNQEEKEKVKEEKDTAKKLQKYFLKPNGGDKKGNAKNLKKLLGANPRDKNGDTKEAKLLKKVFGHLIDNKKYIFPMFNKEELAEELNYIGYLFEINVNSFNGMIADADRNNPNFLKFVIPYPPCPPLGEATLSFSTLKDWMENSDEDKYFPDNPYIPTTCS